MYCCKFCHAIIPTFGKNEVERMNSLINVGTKHMAEEHSEVCSISKPENIALLNMVSAATLLKDIESSNEALLRNYLDNLLIAIVNGAAVLVGRQVKLYVMVDGAADEPDGPEVIDKPETPKGAQ